MWAESWLFKESWNEFVILDFIDVLLLQSSFPPALPQSEHGVDVSTHPIVIPTPSVLTHYAEIKTN